jgi:membrane-bound lytic murein transglycosylase MltF
MCGGQLRDKYQYLLWVANILNVAADIYSVGVLVVTTCEEVVGKKISELFDRLKRHIDFLVAISAMYESRQLKYLQYLPQSVSQTTPVIAVEEKMIKK